MNSRPVSFKFVTKFLEENKIKSEILIEEERKNEIIEGEADRGDGQRLNEGKSKE